MMRDQKGTWLLESVLSHVVTTRMDDGVLLLGGFSRRQRMPCNNQQREGGLRRTKTPSQHNNTMRGAARILGYAKQLARSSLFVVFAMQLLLGRRSAFLAAVAAMSSPSPPPPAASTSRSCAVLGVGVLGTSLCRQLLSDADSNYDVVAGITRTPDRHGAIREQVGAAAAGGGGGGPSLELLTGDEAGKGGRKFDDVVFCAPPSGFEDYPAAVRDAAENLWAGADAGGTFVFTSSGAVYGSGDGSAVVTESTPPPEGAMDNPRMARLLNAERACLDAGGCCLRLAGLYSLERGAHNYWLTAGKDELPSRADGVVNLLHYDDAAGACAAALRPTGDSASTTWRGKIFLISDGHPMTRGEICESALQARVYRGCSLPKFTGTEEGLGKIYDGSKSNEELNWKPRHESFDKFMKENA